MSKYKPLRSFLESADTAPVSMTFAQISDLVDGLPPSAYEHRSWWSNNERRSAARGGWLPAGLAVDKVDLKAHEVVFIPIGDASRRTSTVTPAASPPEPITISAEQVTGLEAFLTFRGGSRELRSRIAEIERAIAGHDANEAHAAAEKLGVNRELMEGARLVKRLAAQVDVVLHASGILQALPHILEPGERVVAVSLGAGNIGRDFDLETDRQIAEFKFINWQGGAESVRQDGVLIDLFNLAGRETHKRRVLYLTGTEIPLRWLENSTRVTRDCLARKRRIPARFNERYGDSDHHYVRDYWAAVRDLVEVVDLNLLVPGLAGIDDGEAE